MTQALLPPSPDLKLLTECSCPGCRVTAYVADLAAFDLAATFETLFGRIPTRPIASTNLTASVAAKRDGEGRIWITTERYGPGFEAGYWI